MLLSETEARGDEVISDKGDRDVISSASADGDSSVLAKKGADRHGHARPREARAGGRGTYLIVREKNLHDR